jgi:hypothetical protein
MQTYNGKEHGRGEEGRRVFLRSKMMPFCWGFFIFYFLNFNKGILVIMHPKTTSFWVFHPFLQFHLTDWAIL